jgi:hypothetical protein
MKLVDIPQRQNFLFLKAKQGRVGVTTRKYPIANNSVIFVEPLIFDYELPEDPSGHHPKPLRLSFRVENSSNSGFTRYGVCEIDIMKKILEDSSDIQVLLSECQFNTYFHARLHLPGGAPWSSFPIIELRRLSEEFPDSEGSAHSASTGQPRTTVTVQSSSSSNRLSTSLYDSSPVKITPAKFQELESQVDQLLAGIINEKQI